MRRIPALAFSATALFAASATAQPSLTPTDNQQKMVPAQMVRQAEMLRARWAELVARGEAPATVVEPAVTAGKILTASIDVTKAPGLPEIQLTLKSGTVGLESVQVTLSSPSGAHALFASVTLPSYPPGQTKFVINSLLQSPFTNSALGLYAEPGGWSISGILILSGDSQFISYGPAQIATLFPAGATVQVANSGTPDVKPPVPGHGTILTSTVSLSSAEPFAAVKLNGKDDVSGIYSGSVNFSAPGGYPNVFGVYGAIDAPVLSGSLTMSNALSSSLTPGTYTIDSFSLCDYAGNCVSDSDSADIDKHFGTTTISVTQ
jgi:hypothetical protein